MHSTLFLISCIGILPAIAISGADMPNFPGKATVWNGFAKHEFSAENQRFLVVEPKSPAPGKPWMWRAEFFGHEPQGDLALLERGWHIVHCPDAAGRYGSPSGVAAWDGCYRILTGTYGLSAKPVLVGFSRGGLLSLNWAIANPERTAGLYLDAPVCDIRSWPAGRLSGPGSKGDWATCRGLYGLTDEQILAYDQGPLNRLDPLIKAKLPILLICGDADKTVPYGENGQILAERYKAAGGSLELILKPGVDHHPHSLKDPAPIVAFALKAVGLDR